MGTEIEQMVEDLLRHVNILIMISEDPEEDEAFKDEVKNDLKKLKVQLQEFVDRIIQ